MTTVKARSTCITRALLLLVALSFLTFSYAAKEDEKSETKTGGTKTGGTGKDMDIDSELRHLFTELMSLNHHRQIQDHENLFQMADKDSNGHIDRNEFEAFVRGNQDSMDNFQMRRHGPEHVFKRNDLDKDGSLNKREWARTSHMPHYMPHFVNPHMWKNPLEIVYQSRGMHSPTSREGHSVKVFEEIDLNKDGKIDEMELKATFSRLPELSMSDPRGMMGPMGPMGSMGPMDPMDPMGHRPHHERERMMHRREHERMQRMMERPDDLMRGDKRRGFDRVAHRNQVFDGRIEQIQKRIQDILQVKASHTFQQLDKNNDKILDKDEWNQGSILQQQDDKLMTKTPKDDAKATDDKKESLSSETQAAKPPTPQASEGQQAGAKDTPAMKSA